MFIKIKLIKFFIFACLLFLTACAASVKEEDSGTVQDIQPGERSIIQPPSSQPAQPARQIEERNI